MTRPYDPAETADDVRASLRRNHAELTDADVDRILGGPPPTRRPGRPFFDNRGKREAVFEAPSTGRTTGGDTQGSARAEDTR